MDPFLSALEDLAQPLSASEDPDQAIAEVAAEHSLAAHALRNRAVRAFGPLETYKERQAASKKERERNAVQADPALAAATFLAEVSNLSPKLTHRSDDAVFSVPKFCTSTTEMLRWNAACVQLSASIHNGAYREVLS